MLYEPFLRNVLRVQYVLLGVIQQRRGQNFAFFWTPSPHLVHVVVDIEWPLMISLTPTSYFSQLMLNFLEKKCFHIFQLFLTNNGFRKLITLYHSCKTQVIQQVWQYNCNLKDTFVASKFFFLMAASVTK